MTVDTNLRFGTAQAVFGNGTAVGSTDWVNMKVAQDNAVGRAPVLEILVTTAFVGGTGCKFRLSAVDSAGNNPVILDQTPDIALADLTLGRIFHLRMSPQTELPGPTLTHLRAYCSNNGNNTAGSVTMHLIPEAGASEPGLKAYPSGW